MNTTERAPKVIGWEITRWCNLTCPHCYSAAAKRPHDELTTDECKRAIDAMARIGVGTIGWTGGEPLLREDLEELTAYASAQGVKANITTNAVLLDERRALSLLEAGNRAIQISLDGSNPAMSYRTRRTTEEEFHRIIEAIRICKKLNIRTHLATLIGQETLDDVREMVKLAKREGVDAIRFCGFTPSGRGKRKEVKDRLQFTEELDGLLEFIHETLADTSITMMFDVSFGPVPPDYSFHKCVAGMETFYLKSNGDVFPCTALTDKQFKVGNIRQTPLEEIWASDAMQAMSRLPDERIHGHCRDCENLSNCHGACKGSVLAFTGDLNASFPPCLYQAAKCASR